MKNQYFGDITDYRKYGILRILDKASVKIGVCWMLTPDDLSKDGKIIKYSNDVDADLYDFLQHRIKSNKRNVKELGESGLLKNTQYFNSEMPAHSERYNYFDNMRKQFWDRELVFFDPDNGIEPPSGCYSEKHIDWCQIKKTWDMGVSLLIIQFPGHDKKHDEQIEEKEQILKSIANTSNVYTFRFNGLKPARPVFFFMLAQQKHKKKIESAKKQIEHNWEKHLHPYPSPAATLNSSHWPVLRFFLPYELVLSDNRQNFQQQPVQKKGF